MALSISDYLQQGPATSKQIQLETGLSQAAVSRQLRRMGKRIIKIQGEHSPKYAMTANAFGGDSTFTIAARRAARTRSGSVLFFLSNLHPIG